jgi:2-hydroxy-3-keto-5-methylthiopentenyl-1-phosphate phosphatase
MQQVGDRRPAVNARFRKGEITAWESNMELLDGLVFSKSQLEAFLHTIDLDSGAIDLVRWCASRKIFFEILSDGFDYNLDRLQEIHGVNFRYAANRLRIHDGRWQIEAGSPNPDCTCGTGTCKWSWIQTYRAKNPGVVCVHIGNGQVSDLCGALAADVAFAKDTLAPALAARGESYEDFNSLSDVVATLERWGL